jgi:hypothetical protein
VSERPARREPTGKRLGGAARAEFFAAVKSQVRVSSDNPILNAFCRVAPAVRFSVLAIVAACVFFRASAFKVRTSAEVHARRFVALLAIKQLQVFRRVGFVAGTAYKEKPGGS